MKTKELLGYTVAEPTVGKLFPIMKLLDTDPQQFQLELAKASIMKDGQPIGDAINDLGIREYMELMKAVLSVSGFDGEQGNA